MPIRIGQREISGPAECVLVLPRLNDDDIVIKARAVLDMDEFNRLCPAPKPKKIMKRGVGTIDDVDDPKFKSAQEWYNQQYSHFLVIMSLKATEGLEWSRVREDKVETWGMWEEELKESGFSDFERKRVLGVVMEANALNEAVLKEARERFFRSQEEKANTSSGQNSEPKSTSSGEPANGSESVPQE